MSLTTPPSTLFGHEDLDVEEGSILGDLREDLELTARNPKGKHGGGQARMAEERRESALTPETHH